MAQALLPSLEPTLTDCVVQAVEAVGEMRLAIARMSTENARPEVRRELEARLLRARQYVTERKLRARVPHVRGVLGSPRGIK